MLSGECVYSTDFYSLLLCTRRKASRQATKREINWAVQKDDSSKLTTLDSTWSSNPFLALSYILDLFSGWPPSSSDRLSRLRHRRRQRLRLPRVHVPQGQVLGQVGRVPAQRCLLSGHAALE